MTRRTVAELPDSKPEDLQEEANPFTSRDPRMLFYAWSGMALRVILVAGGLFSAWQYIERREETRVERTLELVELWEQAEYQQANNALQARIEALNEVHAHLLPEQPSQQELAIYRERIGLASLGEDGGTMPVEEFRAEFNRIVYFLNRVAFCVDSGLCSRTVTNAFFRDYARSFWSYYAAHVEMQRAAGRPEYARAIEKYIRPAGH